MYLGAQRTRERGEAYDKFIEAFVQAVKKLFPNAMLHWEDFGRTNAHRILHRYQDEICSFNDDIQGTAAVVLAAVVAAVHQAGSRLSDQKVIVHGAGTAGIGIAEIIREAMLHQGMSPEEAHDHFWVIDRQGLVVEDQSECRDYQLPYARSRADLADWQVADPKCITLEEVVDNVSPTLMIGTSAQAGAFSERIIKKMAAECERPIIMPLSNPTSRAEARPADLLEWTNGQALVATGSPFGPVNYHGSRYTIAQANNALIFPGIGLGVAAAQATRVTTHMIYEAAVALAGMVNEFRVGASLLPTVGQLRHVSSVVAMAVIKAAVEDGVARRHPDDLVKAVYERMWHPDYPKLEVLPPLSDYLEGEF
jgi:malate dehydrogenase (oxaloacetate-decarboxylating)